MILYRISLKIWCIDSALDVQICTPPNRRPEGPFPVSGFSCGMSVCLCSPLKFCCTVLYAALLLAVLLFILYSNTLIRHLHHWIRSLVRVLRIVLERQQLRLSEVWRDCWQKWLTSGLSNWKVDHAFQKPIWRGFVHMWVLISAKPVSSVDSRSL